MVSTRYSEYRYLTVCDRELDSLLRGEDIGRAIAGDFPGPAPAKAGQTGVLLARGCNSDEPLRPLALVARDQDIRRLCGRYAHLRNDLSPLTAWCHLLTPNTLQCLGGVSHEPNLGGTEAAWAGLVVAEVALLSGRPLAKLRISACLASATFAIARAKALWRELSLDSIVDRFDAANSLCRGDRGAPRNVARAARVRSSLYPIWACLSALADDTSAEGDRDDLRSLALALTALREARDSLDSDEAALLVRPLLNEVPEDRDFERLTETTPESRLGLFDELVGALDREGTRRGLRRHSLALLAGYLATVAAGGFASLGLVESEADRWPELMAWAYAVAGVGERIPWTSGFDGLGRLVAREFQRSLRLDEPPTCDFAFEEARVLWDKELKDPFVHLRIKQARILSVAAYPGVNISIPIAHGTPRGLRQREAAHAEPVPARESTRIDHGDALAALAEALWPYIRERAADGAVLGARPTSRRSKGSGRTRIRQRGSAHSSFPLIDS